MSRAKSGLDFIRGGALEQKLHWRIGLAWGKGSAFSTSMGFPHWLQPLGEEDRSTEGQSQEQLCVSDSWSRSRWGCCNTTHLPNDFKSHWGPEVAIQRSCQFTGLKDTVKSDVFSVASFLHRSAYSTTKVKHYMVIATSRTSAASFTCASPLLGESAGFRDANGPISSSTRHPWSCCKTKDWISPASLIFR